MHSGSSGKGPSIAELQKMVREKQKVVFFLVTGEQTHGLLRWFDEDAFSITLDDGETMTLLRSAVVSYRAGASNTPKSSPQTKKEEVKEAQPSSPAPAEATNNNIREDRANDIQAQLSALEELEKSKLNEEDARLS